MATLCYGNIVNGNNGHDETDVLYLAFTGADAVAGANGAKWNAQNAVEFEASLATLGDILVKRIAGGTGTTSTTSMTTSTKTSTSTTTSKAPTATCTPCSWTGHCAGDDCFTSSFSSSSSSSFPISSATLPSSSHSKSSSSSSKPSSSIFSSATCCPKPTTSHCGANSNSRSYKSKNHN